MTKGHPEGHRWELGNDPDPTSSGDIAEEDRIQGAVLGSRFIGLMSDDTDEAGVVLDLGLGNLLPPRILTSGVGVADPTRTCIPEV